MFAISMKSVLHGIFGGNVGLIFRLIISHGFGEFRVSDPEKYKDKQP